MKSELSLSPMDEVRALYEQCADSYNEMMEEEIELPIYHELLSEVVSKLKRVPGAVVDSSCGTGHMLEKIRDEYISDRELVGVDISPSMIKIARRRLGVSATLFEGDMSSLPQLPDSSCAVLLSFFAIHHVDLLGFRRCVSEWQRVLTHGGLLVLAAWEGEGPIDYGDASEVVARRYLESEVVDTVKSAGFCAAQHSVRPVDDFGMDALYLISTNVC